MAVILAWDNSRLKGTERDFLQLTATTGVCRRQVDARGEVMRKLRKALAEGKQPIFK
jgi:hypothetical protein